LQPATPVTATLSLNTAKVECSIATSRERLSAAFQLLYKQYVTSGIIKPHFIQVWAAPYHLMPTTEVLVAMERDTLVGTMSLVCDSDHGLPLEHSFPDEVASLRLKGVTLAELSCIASTRTVSDEGQSRGHHLMPIASQLAYRRGAD